MVRFFLSTALLASSFASNSATSTRAFDILVEAQDCSTSIRVPDVPPLLSSTAIWSPIPIDKEIGREEALFRRADHRLPA